jgi:hypothetical protein
MTNKTMNEIFKYLNENEQYEKEFIKINEIKNKRIIFNKQLKKISITDTKNLDLIEFQTKKVKNGYFDLICIFFL